jgi:hypothetical protein
MLFLKIFDLEISLICGHLKPIVDYREAQYIAESFLPYKFGDIGHFGDIGTFGDRETEIKNFVQKLKNAWAFVMTSWLDQFLNFLRCLTIGSKFICSE